MLDGSSSAGVLWARRLLAMHHVRFPLFLLAMSGSGPRGDRREPHDQHEHRDVYDTDETHVPERRDRSRHGRRKPDDDTLEPEQLSGWVKWAKWATLHHAKLTLAWGGAMAIGGYLIATYGLNQRVAYLEKIVAHSVERIDQIERSEALKFYMLCTMVKRIDPPGTPPECGPASAPTPPPSSLTVPRRTAP